MTSEKPRAEKVAVVDEVAAKLAAATAVFVTEYRGLRVGQLANLRRSLRSAGGEYKVYKNTLARLGAQKAGIADLDDLLVGPSGLTFVSGPAGRCLPGAAGEDRRPVAGVAAQLRLRPEGAHRSEGGRLSGLAPAALPPPQSLNTTI